MQMFRDEYNEYRIEQPKKALKNSLVLGIVLILVLASVTAIYYLTKVNSTATDESREIIFSVARGTATKQIASNLETEKVISNKYIFIIYSSLYGVGEKIQAGEYSLNSNMTIPEIIDVLTHGRVVSDNRNVTIIEGWNNKQIAKHLASREIIKSESELSQIISKNNFGFKFEDTAVRFKYEGFLFPDTYTLSKTQDATDLVTKMLNNFESKFTDQMQDDITESERTLSQVLILASIIEKEVGRNKTNLTAEDFSEMQRERELVASVFYNRLAIDMGLESDATVNFITGKSDRQPLIEDTKIKSPYNTYQVRGLPPTPISNPGIDAIIAAIYPAESDYLYFLNSPDGTAYFARTLAEHNENRAKYLR